MRKMLVSCVIFSGLACPAVAGERSGVSARPERFTLPVGKARLEHVPAATLIAETRPGALTALEREPSPEITARAGGSYAVADILRQQPRPRPRKSPLGAALVLKLDGNDDSPPFSVGGGGVAAAVWQVVPK